MVVAGRPVPEARARNSGVIEAAMYVAVGFCAAGLLAVAAIQAIWRRAVRLTRDAVQATTPMTYSEVRAEIGALRAAHAIEYRRLEAGVERLQRSAAENRIARDRAESVANDLRLEFASREQALSESIAREDALRRDLVEREEALARARARARELERTVQSLAARTAASETVAELRDPADTPQPATDTAVFDRSADLATIARLEGEVATLTRALEKAKLERPARGGERPAPLVADEIVQLRKELRERDDRLFEAEAKLVAARAELARLSILSDGSGSPAAGNAVRDDRLARAEAETARLRSQLYANEDLGALRRELAELAATVVARIGAPEDLAALDAAPDAAAGAASSRPGVSSGPADPTLGASELPARSPADAEAGDRTQSLAARIRAARERMKADARSRATGTDGTPHA